MHRRQRPIAALLIAAAAVLALGMPGATPPAAADTAKASQVLSSGSDVSYTASVNLTGLYNGSPGCVLVAASGTQPLDFSCLADEPATITTENYSHDVIAEAFPVGASVAVNQLCANVGGVSLVRNTRAARSSDCTGLHFVPWGRDGAAWECFNGCHGVSNLTKAQLQGIYGDCSITNWNQVGGTDGPIKVYSVKPGSGLKSNWNSYLGISDDTHCSPDSAHIIRQNLNGPILDNGDANDAIFYFSIGNHRTNVKTADGSKLGSINGVAPSIVNVGSGLYPISFFLSNVYCAASTGAAPCPVAAPAPVLKYAHESTGWLCKAGSDAAHTDAHSIDPITGVNFRTLILRAIQAAGFASIPYGPTGGSASGSSFCREFET
jgi:phosphate transport system substrate-binding protein